MLDIQFSLEIFKGLTGHSRNRLRKSKILNKLRYIKRQHPALDFIVQRGVNYIVVRFNNEPDFTLFVLLWPAHYPRWDIIEHDLS